MPSPSPRSSSRTKPPSPAEPREPGSVKVTVTLPEELVRDLDARAAAESRSRSNALRVLLQAALARKAG